MEQLQHTTVISSLLSPAQTHTDTKIFPLLSALRFSCFVQRGKFLHSHTKTLTSRTLLLQKDTGNCSARTSVRVYKNHRMYSVFIKDLKNKACIKLS